MKWSRKLKPGLSVTNNVVEPTGGGKIGPTTTPEPKILVTEIKISDLPASELAKLTVADLPLVLQRSLQEQAVRSQHYTQFETITRGMVTSPIGLDIQFNEPGVPVMSGFGSIGTLAEAAYPVSQWQQLFSSTFYWVNRGTKRVNYRLFLSGDNKTWMHWFDGEVAEVFVRTESTWRRNGYASLWSIRRSGQ